MNARLQLDAEASKKRVNFTIFPLSFRSLPHSVRFLCFAPVCPRPSLVPILPLPFLPKRISCGPGFKFQTREMYLPSPHEHVFFFSCQNILSQMDIFFFWKFKVDAFNDCNVFITSARNVLNIYSPSSKINNKIDSDKETTTTDLPVKSKTVSVKR